VEGGNRTRQVRGHRSRAERGAIFGGEKIKRKINYQGGSRRSLGKIGAFSNREWGPIKSGKYARGHQAEGGGDRVEKTCKGQRNRASKL